MSTVQPSFVMSGLLWLLCAGGGGARPVDFSQGTRAGAAVQDPAQAGQGDSGACLMLRVYTEGCSCCCSERVSNKRAWLIPKK
eukprot:917643-Pelagomonas_calceolata.AAC.2